MINHFFFTVEYSFVLIKNNETSCDFMDSQELYECRACDSDGLGSLGKAEVVIGILIPKLWPLPSTPALKKTHTLTNDLLKKNNTEPSIHK